MHKVTIHNLGNADCCRIDLANGKKILFDFAHVKSDDTDDLRNDLQSSLREDLAASKRSHYEVVAFTHLDCDHFRGSTEFFWLDHDTKYQGKGRLELRTMWVPAAFITETAVPDEEGKILQREARHRFKQGRGIRVFSRPERLADWCGKNGISLEDRRSLTTDAGKVPPDFNLQDDELEFFVHSPLAVRQNETTVEDRNGDSIVVQAVFSVGGIQTKMLLMADCPWEELGHIVRVTKIKKNDSRLEWDIIKLPHHCSYKSLAEDKCEDKDVLKPTDEARWLYETKGAIGGFIVSTSEPIPDKGSEEDKDPQPPHRQAANYYKCAVKPINGRFLVTMEHPDSRSPEPIVVEITNRKAFLKQPVVGGVVSILSHSAPRAGLH